MTKSKRIVVAVPDDMHEALKEVSDKSGAPMAGIVRQALEEWLKERGYEVDADVVWGGWRPRGERGTNETH